MLLAHARRARRAHRRNRGGLAAGAGRRRERAHGAVGAAPALCPPASHAPGAARVGAGRALLAAAACARPGRGGGPRAAARNKLSSAAGGADALTHAAHARTLRRARCPVVDAPRSVAPRCVSARWRGRLCLACQRCPLRARERAFAQRQRARGPSLPSSQSLTQVVPAEDVVAVYRLSEEGGSRHGSACMVVETETDAPVGSVRKCSSSGSLSAPCATTDPPLDDVLWSAASGPDNRKRRRRAWRRRKCWRLMSRALSSAPSLLRTASRCHARERTPWPHAHQHLHVCARVEHAHTRVEHM